MNINREVLRYQAQHPDVDWETHQVQMHRLADGAWEARGHHVVSPQLEEIVSRCCCCEFRLSTWQYAIRRWKIVAGRQFRGLRLCRTWSCWRQAYGDRCWRHDH